MIYQMMFHNVACNIIAITNYIYMYLAHTVFSLWQTRAPLTVEQMLYQIDRFPRDVYFLEMVLWNTPWVVSVWEVGLWVHSLGDKHRYIISVVSFPHIHHLAPLKYFDTPHMVGNDYFGMSTVMSKNIKQSESLPRGGFIFQSFLGDGFTFQTLPVIS